MGRLDFTKQRRRFRRVCRELVRHRYFRVNDSGLDQRHRDDVFESRQELLRLALVSPLPRSVQGVGTNRRGIGSEALHLGVDFELAPEAEIRVG